MAIKFGTDGTLYANSVKYNWKQARNLIADGNFSSFSGVWTLGSGVNFSNVPKGYKVSETVLFSQGETTGMMTQSMPTPIVGHKYYGSIMWKTTGSSFSSSDNRFEWYCKDSSDGTMVFANKNIATNGNWVRLSSIQSLSSVASGSWMIRNFLVSPSTSAYCCRLMIIDLTDTFGSGSEPTKEWCDNNIREHEVYASYGCVSNNVTTRNYNTQYTASSFETWSYYNYLGLNSRWEPREYMISCVGSTSNAEGYITSASNFTLNNTYKYYGYVEAHTPYNTYPIDTSYDMYFPVAEPLLGQTPQAYNRITNGGGGMYEWKRVSFFNNRSSFTSGSYLMRFDYNNSYRNYRTRITAINLINPNSALSQYNSYNGTSVAFSYVNKQWCDRWIDGYSSPIIHIKDPNNKQIKFKCPLKEIKRSSTSSYSKSALDSYVGLTNDTWGNFTNLDGTEVGKYVYITVKRSDDDATCRFVIRVTGVSGTNVTGNNLGYGKSGSFWWGMCEGYDIECNDIEIRPEMNKITMDSTGTIKCKMLLLTQKY